MFYSLFVHSRVFLPFRELSVPLSPLHFTICWIGGWRMVRCSLGSVEPSVGSRPACEAPEPDRATSLLPGYRPTPDIHQSHEQEWPERVDLVSLALLYVQPFCSGFKMHFSKQITELKKQNKSDVHEFSIKSFLQ